MDVPENMSFLNSWQPFSNSSTENHLSESVLGMIQGREKIHSLV